MGKKWKSAPQANVSTPLMKGAYHITRADLRNKMSRVHVAFCLLEANTLIEYSNQQGYHPGALGGLWSMCLK